MLLTRWKLMAGILGVSIGGLAAAASQCPKFDSSKGRSTGEPVAKVETKVAPAGPAATPAPPPPAPDLPAIPDFGPPATKPTDVAPPAPPKAETKPETKPTIPSAPMVSDLLPPTTAPGKPESKPTPPTPPVTGHEKDPLIKIGGTQPSDPGKPVASPPNTGSPTIPPSGIGSSPAMPPSGFEIPPPG